MNAIRRDAGRGEYNAHVATTRERRRKQDIDLIEAIHLSFRPA